MGGRGASLGNYYLHGKHHTYGDEYESVLEIENIKFVKRRDDKNTTSPRETMTKDRIYVTVDKNKGTLNYISFYDETNKRYKQIDLQHEHKRMKPHVHIGYEHSEGGTRNVNDEEKLIIDKVLNAWKNKNSK